MRAALLYENSTELKIDNVNDPALEPGEALVRVKKTGICHSDLNIIDGVIRPPSYPHVLGHEIAGVVEDARPADQMDKTILNELSLQGNRAVVYFYITCGRCEYCLRGRENLCYNYKRIGFELWGGYAELVKVPIKNLVPLPKELDYNAAVLTDAGATSYHALRKAGISMGDNVLVIGAGGLGTMILQIAKASGASTVVIDKVPAKLDYAKSLGADVVINIGEIDKPEKDIEPRSIDIAVDTVGLPETINLSLNLLKRDGKLIILGYSKQNVVNMITTKVIYDELNILGARASTKSELVKVLDLARRGLVKINVTNEYRFDEVNKSLNDLRRGVVVGRGVITFP
ncbi:MAG: alcohol dehydrogenase catalytic domain-containing protein [Thermofilum sp.]